MAHPGVTGWAMYIHRDTTDTTFMHSIIRSSPAKISDLSISGIHAAAPDPFAGDWHDEPCDLTHGDEAQYVDADDRGDDDRPESGGVMRLSEAHPESFWAYFDRFVRYWPRKTFHVKPAYEKGFLERKRKGTWKSLPLFDQFAVEMAERHLNAPNWAGWKGEGYPDDPIWLALHMPKSTTVDLIDVDAKQYRIGYYREGGSDKARLMPVVHLPLDQFKLLKRVYDAFPGRIWCISSETMGVHAWKKHDRLQPSVLLHRTNKNRLAGIGLPAVEAHPMPGRCLRRPFGDAYRTVTPTGVIADWIEQIEYFECDGRTPAFTRICVEMVTAMYRQWHSWERWGDNNRKVNVRSALERHWHELQEVADWLKAGCPLDPAAAVTVRETVHPSLALSGDVLAETLGESPPKQPEPHLRISRAILLVTFGEKTREEIAPILKEASDEIACEGRGRSLRTGSTPKAGSGRMDLASLRGGNWAKELLRLARAGLEEEDSIGTVVYEMAKWLWWIELYTLPVVSRREEVIRLLTAYVLKKHNGCVTRLLNGQERDVIDQIARCVATAAEIEKPASLKGFAATRAKWSNGGYKHPIRIIPALQGHEDVSLLSSRQFTVMCINFDDTLPASVQHKIKAVAGRNRGVMHFATGLLNWLYSRQGKAFLRRTALTKMLGYKNPNQIAKYVGILERAGVIRQDDSYSVGRNGKGYYLKDTVMDEMRSAYDQGSTA